MIYPYKNVLTSKECQELINFSLPRLKDLVVMTEDGQKPTSKRTGQGVFIQDSIQPIIKAREIVSKLTNLPVENQELPNVVNYKKGNSYKPHYDFFTEDKFFQNYLQNGGQRKYSCIFYLNDNFKEGGTFFPEYNILVKPKLGNLIIWSNLGSNGKPNLNSLHTGLPVKEGEKWILVIWVRQFRIIN